MTDSKMTPDQKKHVQKQPIHAPAHEVKKDHGDTTKKSPMVEDSPK